MFGTAASLFILGIVLIIAGLVLAGVEMVLPGFSVPGICAIICLIAGVALCAGRNLALALMISGIILALLVIMFVLVLVLFQKGKFRTPLMLKEETDGVSSDDLSYMLGSTGTVINQLHPVGTAMFGDTEYEVISEGRLIPEGESVTVIKVNRSKLTVRLTSEVRTAETEE